MVRRDSRQPARAWCAAVDQEAIAVEWYEAKRPFPGLIIWRQELNELMGYGQLLKAFEELAQLDNPLALYPIVRIWPKR